jgi:hypothetical protein
MEFLLCPEMFVTRTSSDRERPSRVTETPPERLVKESPGANALQLKSVAGRYVTGWMGVSQPVVRPPVEDRRGCRLYAPFESLVRIGIFDRQTYQPYALNWEYRLNIMMRLQMHWRVHRLLFAQ